MYLIIFHFHSYFIIIILFFIHLFFFKVEHDITAANKDEDSELEKELDVLRFYQADKLKGNIGAIEMQAQGKLVLLFFSTE